MYWLEGLIIFTCGWIAHYMWDRLKNKDDDDDEQGAGEQNYSYHGQ